MPPPGPAIAAARATAAASPAARATLLRALASHAGNQSAAAEALELSLATLKRRLAAAGLTPASLRARWPLSGRQGTR